jgi:hypothetical protein
MRRRGQLPGEILDAPIIIRGSGFPLALETISPHADERDGSRTAWFALRKVLRACTPRDAPRESTQRDSGREERNFGHAELGRGALQQG